MSTMSTRTVALSSKELDSSIEVLSSAGHALQLTRFERFSYFALIITANLITFLIAFGICVTTLESLNVYKRPYELIFAYNVAVLVCITIGLVSLALNIPFLRKTLRERARLKQLGLSSLYRFLWKESRRGQWKRRVREIVFAVIFIWAALSAVLFFMFPPDEDRLQRARMDLTASAEELRRVLQSLRRRENSGVVSVPASLLEQTAKIESAQIAEERKDAILEGVASRPTGYAIAFDRDAAEQRATLDVADRIELADLVAQLSIAGMQLEPRQGMQRGKTESNRIEIEYIIDNASRSIRIIAARRVREVFPASVSGASHA